MNTLIIVAALIFISIAYIGRTKGEFGERKFFLGLEDSGAFRLTLSLSASWIGAASLLALSGWVQKFGVSAIWYLLFPGLGLILISIVGVKAIKNMSGTAIFDYFDNKIFRYVFGLFLAFMYTMILSAQFAGFAKLSSVFGFSYEFGLIASALVVAFYISIGGFSSVRDTDIAQFVLIVFSVIVLFITIPVNMEIPSLLPLINPTKNLPDPLFYLFASLGLMMFVAQENHQRIKAAKDIATARIACFSSGVLVAAFAFAIAVLVNSVPLEKGNPILNILPRLDPVWLYVVALGFMGAALSTADTSLNIASYSMASMLKKDGKAFYYVSVVLVSALSVLIAFFVPSVGKIIMFCVNMYTGIALPVVASVMIFASSEAAVFIAVLAMGSVIGGYYSGFSAPGIYGLSAGGAGMIAYYFIARARS